MEGSEAGRQFNAGTLNRLIEEMRLDKSTHGVSLKESFERFCTQDKLSNYMDFKKNVVNVKMAPKKNEGKMMFALENGDAQNSLNHITPDNQIEIIPLNHFAQNGIDFELRNGVFNILGALISNNSEMDLNYMVLENDLKFVVLVSLPGTLMENNRNEVKLKRELHFYWITLVGELGSEIKELQPGQR